MTIITGTLSENLCMFMIISRSFLLRVRNVTDKCRRENLNTRLMFNNFISKIVSFRR